MDLIKLLEETEKVIDEIDIKCMSKWGIEIDPYNYDFVTGYPPLDTISRIENGNDKIEEIFNLNSERIKSIYIHIPYCNGRCVYCYFYKCINNSYNPSIDEYLSALKREAEIIRSNLKNLLSINSIYIGGGTPSLLTEKQIEELFKIIGENFKLEENAEITFEAHPSDLIETKVKLLNELGVNRISFGTQTFDKNLLKKLNRRHDEQDSVKAINILKKLCFDNYNIDLMYGFPDQDFESIFNDLKTLINGNVPSITYYRVEIKKNTNLWKLPKDKFPDAKTLLKMTAFIFKGLINAGYIQDKVNWFVQDNNYKYKQQDYKWNNNFFIGLGPSSYFYLNDYYCQNSEDIEDYIKKLNKNELPIAKMYKLNDMEKMRRFMALGIKTSEGINIENFKSVFGKYPNEVFPETLDKLRTLKLIEEDRHIKLSDKGLLFSDMIAENFFSEKIKNALKEKRNAISRIIDEERKFHYIKELKAASIKFIENISDNIHSEENFKNHLNNRWKKEIQNKIIEIFDYLFGDKLKWWVYHYWSTYYNKRLSYWAQYHITRTNPNEGEFIKKLEDWYYQNVKTSEVIGLYNLIFELPKDPEEAKKFYPKYIKLVFTDQKELFYDFNLEASNPEFFLPYYSDIKNLRNQIKNNVQNLKEMIENNLTYFKNNGKFSIFIDNLFKALGKTSEKNSIINNPDIFFRMLLFVQLIDPEAIYLYYVPSQVLFGSSSGGFLFAVKDEIEDLLPYLSLMVNFLGGQAGIGENKELLIYYLKYISIISILVESYAHNIGAHGLEGLKIYLEEQWKKIKDELSKEENQSILRLRTLLLNNTIHCNNTCKEMIKSHSNFINYLSYLQGKSAFWAAIARGGSLFGGKISNVWELINDFAKNNLLCGSLGASEGYEGIRFFIKYNGNEYCIGDSTIEDDFRFRFEEEDLINDYKKAYEERIKKQIVDENLEIIKKELEKLEIFLPEGIVGQQAVYTMWENIIRNVKHCKKPDNSSLIPFHIEIENSDAWITVTNWVDLDPLDPVKLENSVKEMNDWKGILSENNKPNMGGTSQNILCAGMVFAQDYIKTEKLQKTEDKKLINFEILKFMKEGKEKKRLKISFKIWKGKEVGSLEEIEATYPEDYSMPLGRMKIIKLKNKEEIEKLLKRPFLLRYTVDNNNEFKNLYKKWVNEFIPCSNQNNEKIKIKIQEKICYFENFERKNENSINFNYYFYHREADSKIESVITIPYKIHDKIGKLFNNIGVYDPNALEELILAELIEILETSFEIYDNRLFKLSERFKDPPPDLSAFKIFVYKEKEEEIKKLNGKESIHFGIFHLSFIEEVTNAQNAEAINNFLNAHNSLLSRYRFIIITTGRGRDWWDGLDDNLKIKVKFIPIENLERCFEDAIYFAPKTPSIGAKYALIKTIFGS